jgi:nucleoside-diphosphate-sugar epimerase
MDNGERPKCLLTGYPGFLGSQLYRQLQNRYELFTLGLGNAQSERHAIADLSRGLPGIRDLRFDLVIHAAGAAHVRGPCAEDNDVFHSVNYLGTLNLLRALDELTEAPRAFVLISSVSVYGREQGDRIAESASLDAADSYGRSKIRAEEAVLSWHRPETIKGILRLPLVVGRRPPGNLGRMLSAIVKGRYCNVAGGKAKRSLVWIEDVGPFVGRLATRGGIYNLTDGQDVTFADLSRRLCACVGRKASPSLPGWVARALARGGDAVGRLTRREVPFDSQVFRKMTTDLTFSCEKAMTDFHWQPTPVLSRLDEICDR